MVPFINNDITGAGTIQRLRCFWCMASIADCISDSTSDMKSSKLVQKFNLSTHFATHSINDMASMFGISMATPGIINSQHAATT